MQMALPFPFFFLQNFVQLPPISAKYRTVIQNIWMSSSWDWMWSKIYLRSNKCWLEIEQKMICKQRLNGDPQIDKNKNKSVYMESYLVPSHFAYRMNTSWRANSVKSYNNEVVLVWISSSQMHSIHSMLSDAILHHWFAWIIQSR